MENKFDLETIQEIDLQNIAETGQSNNYYIMDKQKKHRLPRKMKKLFKKKLGHVSDYYLESLAWIFHKRLVIARNYIRAKIPFERKEWQPWAKRGLLKDNYWHKKFNY